MKNLKEEKGITLVALIITIVVLLILAVVSIGAVQDSGIIAHAQNAAGGYNQGKANEIDATTKSETTINKYVPGEQKTTVYAYKGGIVGGTMIILPDNRYIMVDVEIEGTYKDITKFNELGYTFENPNNLQYSKIILLNINGSERTCAVITADKKTIHFGEFDGSRILCEGAPGDSAVWDEEYDVSEYLK